MEQETMEFFDRKGRRLELFDIVKVFHYMGARRKRNYMYKQVVEKKLTGGVGFFVLHHLQSCGETFLLRCNDKINCAYEIVQGFKGGVPFEDRERRRGCQHCGIVQCSIHDNYYCILCSRHVCQNCRAKHNLDNVKNAMEG